MMPSLFRRHKHESEAEQANGTSTPPLAHDYVEQEKADAPVADKEGLEGGASILVDISKRDGEGTEAVGTAAQSRNFAHGSVLLSAHGEPVSGLPADARGVETILTSGAKGLGPEGLATLRSLQASPVEDSNASAVIAPAKGIAPEAVLTTEPPARRRSLLRKRVDVAGDGESGSERPVTNAVLNAISSVMPENVLGVNLAQLGMNPDATKENIDDIKQNEGVQGNGSGEEADDARKHLPTYLLAGAPPAGRSGEPGVSQPATPAVPDGLLKIERATEEENDKFHSIFEKLPHEDKLIEDHACALHRQILVQGRLYLSQHHICFHANILGVITNLVLPLSEIVTIEKRNTALVIPNAIELASLHARHTFASFFKRDDVFDRIVEVWRFTHPETSAPPVDAKRVTILDEHADEETGSLTEKPTAGTVGDSASLVSVETTDTQGQKVHKRRKLGKLIAGKLSIRAGKHGADDKAEGIDEDDEANAGDGAKGGHTPTTCNCSGDDGHLKETALDAKFSATPEKIFQLIFNSAFEAKFLSQTEKLTELQLGEWEPQFESEGAKRDVSYVKPLNASMGPKTAKCLINQSHSKVDSETFYSTLTVTRTPGVPAGSSFEVRTRTCITHAGGDTSRVFVTTEVHWHTVNRFLKNIIEKSAIEGQVTYHKDLQTEMRKHIRANPGEFGAVDAGDEDEEAHDEEAAASSPKEASKGGLLSMIDLQPTPAVIGLVALVIVLLLTNIITWLSLRRSSGSKSNDPFTDMERQSLGEAIKALEARMDAIKARASRIASL